MNALRGCGGDGESVTAERGFAMTPTARWAAAQRRKRQIINQTVIDRALNDPRRHDRPVAVAAQQK
jgi:hypothetical protein